MRAFVSLLLPLLLIAMPVTATETRTASEGDVSPPATVDGLDWLTGRWVGEGIGGARAQEIYSAPAAGSVAGHFVQEDGEGGIAFFEIMQIAEQDGSLVYRLKHFNADLTGWEEKNEVISFPLVAIEPDALYFDGLTVRKDGEDRLLGAVQVRQEDGSIEEYVFHYHRAEKPSPSCPDATTTIEMNQCYAAVAERAQERMEQYLAAALSRHADTAPVVAGIRASQDAFLAYREQACSTVYENWKDGTIRTVMSLSCTINLTDERTLALWRSWLTYMDSTPPTLPEPGSTE